MGDGPRRHGLRARLAATLAVALAVVAGVCAPVTAQAATSGWLHTSGSRILSEDGSTFVIKAANWFGMETPDCAPHGLWTISLDDGLSQIAAMGFNTVRLPYSTECLAGTVTSSIDATRNPGLVSLSPLKLMDAFVARARAHGLRVILDRHRIESAGQSPLWYTSRFSEQRWIDDWTLLATRYRDDPTVIGVDLSNEPHGSACWGCGDPSVDWAAAATRAGNAVLAANPRLLVIVEGVERQSDGTSTWWGGGLKDAAAHPVSLSVAHRLVYSPHDYPASVYAQSWFGDPAYPGNLPGVWTANWGYLAQNGTAPVLIGEFGTMLQTQSDRQWLTSLVSYIRGNGLSFGYWSFNPNSGDTGGLVQDDWKTPQSAKLAALQPILGSVVPAPTPTPSPTSSPTPKPSPTPTQSRTPTPTPTPIPNPTPKPSPTPTPKPSPSPSGSAAPVTAAWSLQSSWQAGYVADLSVTASAAVSRWTVSWASPSATSIVNAWGMSCATSSGTITCSGTDWAGPLAAGQNVRVGLQVAATSAPSSPKVTVTATPR